ncbi:MAG: hypothetical protein JO329_15540, partial [Planctomycetaceae bacterium]|nr:hypothetical protein [Planctomycetaceae bacterium]
TPELRIFFNLGGERRTLPPDLATGSPAFRSEVGIYGAEDHGSVEEPLQLVPHEFLIVGDLGVEGSHHNPPWS